MPPSDARDFQNWQRNWSAPRSMSSWYTVGQQRSKRPSRPSIQSPSSSSPTPTRSGPVSWPAWRARGARYGTVRLHSDLVAKRLELLKDAVPTISRVAVLHNTTPLSLSHLRDTQAAASALRLTVVPVEIRDTPEPADIDRAFTTIRRGRAEGLNVIAAAAGLHVSRVAELAVKSRILTISTTRRSADQGYDSW